MLFIICWDVFSLKRNLAVQLSESMIYFCFSGQGCVHCWLSQIPRCIPIWCGSQLAWKPFGAAFLEFSENEDVYFVGRGPDELRNYIKLLQCTFF